MTGPTDPSAIDARRTVQDDPRAPSLVAILSALPPDTLLPVRWLLERLSLEGEAGVQRHGTLSAQEFGALRRPPRTADWVREKCALGEIAGAFKDGGEWRVPQSALHQQPSRPHEPSPSAGDQGRSTGVRADGPRYPRWRRD